MNRLFAVACAAGLLALAAPALRAADDAADASPVARLQITTQPPQATVLIDRQARGESPLTLTNLTAGTHLIDVRQAGYAEAWQTVELQPQDSRALEIKLDPLTGLVLVQSVPTNADISTGGVDLGRTPALLTSLPLGAHRIKIATPGYQPKEVEIKLEDRTPLRVEVALVSDSAALTVESEVTGAQVRVNGIDRGASPCTVDRIPEGEVAVEVRAEGYAPFLQKLKLAAGQVEKIQVPLTPLPAALRVVSLPDKARVYLNNEFRGQTPIDIPSLAPGNYRVRVETEGCEPDARSVDLARGASRTEEFRLVSNAGRIELITEPDAVSVFLDGRKLGETKARSGAATAISDPLPLENVATGQHEMRLLRKGYFDKTQPVQIEQGKTMALHVTLTRRFIPDYQVVTDRAVYKGVLDSTTEEFIRLETAPGVMATIPTKDIKSRQALHEDGRTE